MKCLCGKEYPDYMANLVCKECKQFIPDGEWTHDKKIEEQKYLEDWFISSD